MFRKEESSVLVSGPTHIEISTAASDRDHATQSLVAGHEDLWGAWHTQS